MMCIFTYLILHWIRNTSNQSLPKTFVSSKACRLGWPPFASGLDPRTKLDAQFLGPVKHVFVVYRAKLGLCNLPILIHVLKSYLFKWFWNVKGHRRTQSVD